MKKLMIAGMAVLMMACKGENQAFHFDEMTYSPRETVFKLFAPADAACFVVVGNDSVKMTLGKDSIWTATVKGDRKGQTYEFV
ncbi:MAG: hypothetical protein IJ885_01665, partial [Prevotella sp.]|nr:hypothetical protein [Prevotella sp.]